MGVGVRDPEDLLEDLEAGEAVAEMMEHLDLVEVVVDLEEEDFEVRFSFTIVPRKKKQYLSYKNLFINPNPNNDFHHFLGPYPKKEVIKTTF